MKEKSPIEPRSDFDLYRIGRLAYGLEILHYLQEAKLREDHDGGDRVITYHDEENHNITFFVDDAWKGVTTAVCGILTQLKEEGKEEDAHIVIEKAKVYWKKKK